jgi:CRISPR-associated protein Cmr2
MPQHLINIAVGPVQEFIASARKLRDLWYGSFLLSELSKAVACSLHEQGCELIFPAVGNPDDLQPKSAMNVANKILAISPNGAVPDEIVSRARSAFRDSWQKICTEALAIAKDKKITGLSAIQDELFQQQVDDAGEFYAAWLKYDETDYKGCRERCEQRLAGRKNLREFSAPAWNGAGKPKSSLDGIRESVFKQTGADSYIVNRGEQLDALGIVKRFGPLANTQRPYFDNMAQIASLPFLAGLEKASGKHQKINNILDGLPTAAELYPDKNDRPPETSVDWAGWPKGLSTEILFPAILEKEVQQRKKSRSADAWNKAAKQLKALWRCTAEPLPYSCLLVGDGDNMGKTLSALKEKGQHKQFSAELDSFARDVHDLLKEHQGQVIYSGGDDVMAYVPLHTAIECAAAVNAAFAASMAKACAGTEINPVPTFSMGLVIVHQHKPLHQVLELARAAEHHA